MKKNKWEPKCGEEYYYLHPRFTRLKGGLKWEPEVWKIRRRCRDIDKKCWEEKERPDGGCYESPRDISDRARAKYLKHILNEYTYLERDYHIIN